MIGTDREISHAQVVETLCLKVQVDQHLFVGVQTALFATINAILLALLFAVVVEVAAVGNRHRFIGLLDATLHFVVESFLQSLSMGQHRFRISVFGFEIGLNGWVVTFPLPVVMVDSFVAVIAMGDGLHRRHRRLKVCI